MLAGEVIAERFELERLADVGGMGAVFRARDRVTGGVCAVKLMRDPGGGHDQRFLREAALLAELRHPAIVRYLAHGRTASGDLYLAMEWLEGIDLARRLAQGALPADEAITLVRRVADGLALLHDRGGQHRDLKPANLFLEDGRPDRVKVLDFGIARAAAAIAVTRTGTIMGTPGYTAPEQARGARDVDARADVFALGCVLFECLTGRAAFRGDHAMAVLARILLEEPPRLIDVAPDAPPALDGLIGRMLDKDPSRRPRDGAEVRDLLDHVAAATGGARARSPALRTPSLGSDEQRFMCLVLCAMPGEAAGLIETAETLPPRAPPRNAGVEPTLRGDTPATPEHLAAIVRSHGARLESLVDGSWIALADRGHARAPAIDQAAQAARVALALARALPQARLAIAAGRGVQAGRAPVGDVIDRAIAMVARPGITVDALSAGLLGPRFDLAPVLGDEARFVLRGEHAGVEIERRILGRATPCLGRERELSTLIGLFDECVTESCARAVLVKGPDGCGKSRVRTELVARLRAGGVAFEWLFARGDPLQAGAPFAIAGQVVRRAAGIVDGEPAAQRRARLIEKIGADLEPEDRVRVTGLLGEMAHVPGEAGPTDAAARRDRDRDRDPMIAGDQLRRAWEDWLGALTAKRPVVLALDDLHLGDLSSLKLVDAALRNLRERPLYVLGFARPEIDLVFPALWSERGVVTMALPELSRRTAARLVHEILGDESPAVVDRIVQQAGGNAFYLEELCRVTRDGGGDGGELPGTVLAMAQARLEALDPESRRLIRAGAIFGGRFTRAGVLALWGDPEAQAIVDAMLRDLVDAELLEPASDDDADPAFAFRHVLVREAAYAMLTDADRRLGHRLAAAHLQAIGTGDRVLLAEHFERGGLPERAIEGYLVGAREALQGNDLGAVLSRVERAVACGAGGARLGEVLVLRAEALRWRAEYRAASEAASLAMAALPAGSAPWCIAAAAALGALVAVDADTGIEALLDRFLEAPVIEPIMRLRALARFAVSLYLVGRYGRADELAAHLDGEVARIWPDDALLEARVYEVRSFRAAARGEQGNALDLLLAAEEAYVRAGDLRNACMTANNIGYTLVQLGAVARGLDVLEAAIRDAERMGIPDAQMILRENLAVGLIVTGQHDRARAQLERSYEDFRRQNDLHMAALSRVHRGQLYLAEGDPTNAEREATAALEWLGKYPPTRALAHATIARARTAAGNAEAGLGAARDAFAILEQLGGLDEGEMLVRLALAEALAAGGRTDEARAVTAVAIARLDRLTAAIGPELAPGYAAIDEHRALRALAASLGSPG